LAANFNNSAWFYDTLARLVYGKALVQAQVYLLNFIPEQANVLIVGGGTGWVLDELTKLHPSGLAIIYVEISENMMALSQKRNTGGNKVVFINDAIEKVDLPNDFTIVLTPFLLDNFTDENLDKIFRSINRTLRPGGIWLNASFQLTGKWWQWILLKSMFVFFKMICGIEASKLPDITTRFDTNGYALINQEGFFGDFMRAAAYKK